MSGIDNTAADSLRNFVGLLGAGDGYIEGMEAAGQRQVVNSDSIPTKGPTDELVALGFTLGDPDPTDPLFRPCTLPPGWRRVAGSHSMWSNIVDENGRPRVAVFYKAAFYDRRAFCRVNTVDGYVGELLWCDAPMPAPIVDGWTTRDLLIEAVTVARTVALKEATERDSFYPEGAESARVRVARCDRLLEQLGATDA